MHFQYVIFFVISMVRLFCEVSLSETSYRMKVDSGQAEDCVHVI